MTKNTAAFQMHDVVASSKQAWFTQFGFPNQVSTGLVTSLDQVGKTILDVGSGGNARFGMDLCEMGVKSYTAMDIRRAAIEQIQSEFIKNGFREIDTIIANINDFEPQQNFDIVHQRFVLMHYQGDRAAEMQKLIGLAKQAAIFVEYNWRSLEGQDIKLLDEFLDCIYAVFKISNSDPYIGEQLLDLSSVSGPVTATIKVHQAPQPSHSAELFRLGTMIADNLAQRALWELRTRLMGILDKIHDRPFEYKPIHICSLVVTKPL